MTELLVSAFFALLAPAFVSGFNIFAQSRPPAITSDIKKTNRRPPSAETKPTPKPAVDEDENTTNIPSVAAETNAVPEDDVLKIDTNLVTFPVKVSDRSDRFIGGLKKEDFKIYEDDAEQEIAYFSNENEPFTVALVLDMSYSSTFKINEIQDAANAFVNQLRPDDRVMVVSFDEEIHVLSEPTSDREQLRNAIRQTAVASGTSLYEAMDFVIKKRFARIPGRKAIVLFTDGVDTTSRRVFSMDNISAATELDALIYPVEYDTYSDVQRIKNNPTARVPQVSTVPLPIPGRTPNPSPLPFPLPTGAATPSSQGTSAEDYRRADEYLQDLANRTGGRVYRADTTVNLVRAFSNIADELRQIYSVGFYPNESKTEKRRKLKVRVNRPGAVVRAKDGYTVAQKKQAAK